MGMTQSSSSISSRQRGMATGMLNAFRHSGNAVEAVSGAPALNKFKEYTHCPANEEEAPCQAGTQAFKGDEVVLSGAEERPATEQPEAVAFSSKARLMAALRIHLHELAESEDFIRWQTQSNWAVHTTNELSLGFSGEE